VKVSEINPFIRFAERLFYQSAPVTVNVFDCRLFCALSGSAEIIIENQRYTLSPGSIFYCAAGSVYTINAEKGSLIFALNFDLGQHRCGEISSRAPMKLSETVKPIFKKETFIEDCDIFNGHFFLNDNRGLTAAVEMIIKEFSEKNIFFRERCSSALKNLLIDIYRLSLKQAKSSSLAVENAINYIKSNYERKITNKDISSITGYHEYHVNRLFERYTGMSIHKYVIETRIAESKRLLLGTEMPIYGIAEATGFNSSAHFTTCFKKLVGLSPLVYKDSMKGKI
jgi:AraC-like DNA-binding protein